MLEQYVDVTLFLTTFATLFVIQDPAGTLPVFIALTAKRPAKERHRAARVAAITSFMVITVFVLFGRYILTFLGITVPALQLSGGLVLLLIALDLLAGKTGDPEDSGDNAVNVALVPLGTPLLAGPGAIVASMVAIEQSGGRTSGWIAVGAAIVLVHIIIYVSFRFAGIVHRILGVAGTLLITRIAGLLLAAIAVQMIASAIFGFLEAREILVPLDPRIP